MKKLLSLLGFKTYTHINAYTGKKINVLCTSKDGRYLLYTDNGAKRLMKAERLVTDYISI